MSRAPVGTKPWRKAWRKRWRVGSSFVALSMPAKLVVMWVEENADDTGSATTTTRYLASVIGGAHHKAGVARMVVWRAIREAASAGILRIEPGQEAGHESGHAPTKLTRVNFKEYQEREESTGTGTGTGLGVEPGLSSRGKQKKQKQQLPETDVSGGGVTRPAKPKRQPIPPAFFATLADAGIAIDQKGRFAALRLAREGMAWSDIATLAVIGCRCCGARTVWFALSADFRPKVTSPEWALESHDARSKYESNAQAALARGSSPLGVGTPGEVPATPLRLPDPGPSGPSLDQPTPGPGRPAGDVQDGDHADLGSQPGSLGKDGHACSPRDGRGRYGDCLPLAALWRDPD
jgi:hypothetical protein